MTPQAHTSISRPYSSLKKKKRRLKEVHRLMESTLSPLNLARHKLLRDFLEEQIALWMECICTKMCTRGIFLSCRSAHRVFRAGLYLNKGGKTETGCFTSETDENGLSWSYLKICPLMSITENTNLNTTYYD